MTSQVHLHQESHCIHMCILFTYSLVYYIYDQILSLLTKCLNKMNLTSDNMISTIKKFGNYTIFFKLFTFFWNKPKQLGMITMSLYDSLRNPTENFQILTLPCHSQTVVMATMALLAKILEWQWYYDLALDSLLLTATSRVWLYIFLQHVCYCFRFESAFNI